jgi:hypothetical protein
MSFTLAQKVADVVLYEGYVLYPYRASSAKNRVRFQFGVVAPRGSVEPGGSDWWDMQTECLVEPGADPVVDLKVRFLQLQARAVEAARGDAPEGFEPVEFLDLGDERLVAWDEGVERELELGGIPLAELLAAERRAVVAVPGGEDVEALRTAAGELRGRLVRRRWPIEAVVRLTAETAGTADGLLRLRVRIENQAAWPPGAAPDRDVALRTSLLGAHTMLAVRGGAFVSLLDPPQAAATAAAACANLHTWPVLIGPAGSRDVMLSSPIILYDHPAVAEESPGDLCDATEIDEILTLRIMTLTEDEKREARGTDARARQIVNRSDTLPPEVMERLHGAVRSLAPAAEAQPDLAALAVAAAPASAATLESWEDFLNPPGMAAPEEATLEIAGALLARGSRVRLKPSRRSDSMDLFLAGRVAQVAAIHRDVEGESYLAVTLEDDPAAELHAWFGRYFYFYPDEVEPLPAGAATAPEAAREAAGQD